MNLVEQEYGVNRLHKSYKKKAPLGVLFHALSTRLSFTKELTLVKDFARALGVLVFAMKPSINGLARLRTIRRKLDHLEIGSIHGEVKRICEGKRSGAGRCICDASPIPVWQWGRCRAS